MSNVLNIRQKPRSDNLGKAAVEGMKIPFGVANGGFTHLTRADTTNISHIYRTASALEIAPAIDRFGEGLEMFETSKKTGDTAGQALGALEITRGATTTGRIGVDISASVTGIAASTASKTSQIAKAATALGTASGIAGIVATLFKMIPLFLLIHQNRIVQKALKSDDYQSAMLELYETNPHDLKRAAPKLFEAMESKKTISKEMRVATLKKLDKSRALLAAGTTAFLLGITASVLALVFTGGTGAVVAAVVGIIVTFAASGIDLTVLIESLRKTERMTKKDLIINIVAIVIGVAILAASVALAPGLGLAIGAGVVGAISIAIPVISIILIKAKEAKLAEEIEKKKRLLARDIIRLSEKDERRYQIERSTSTGYYTAWSKWFG